MTSACTPAPARVSKGAATTKATDELERAPEGGTAGAAGSSDEQEPRAEIARVPVELHEWGLVGSAIADSQTLTQVASGPAGKAVDPASEDGLGLGIVGIGGGGGGGQGHATGKPVIYAHLSGDAEQRLSVTVRTAGGAVIEHWPQGEVVNADGGGTLSWNVTVKPSASCKLAPWPSASDPRCTTTADGYCELQDLATYATTDGACLAVGDADYDHLFYRASSSVARSALKTLRDEKGFVVVGRREGASAPDTFLHVRRQGSSLEVTRYSVADEAILIPAKGRAPGGEEVTDPRAWLAEALIAGGLTTDERDAFLRAWERDLLAPMPKDSKTARRGAIPLGLAPSRESILYVMTSAELDLITSLEVTPRPAAIKRVFLTHIDLMPPGK